MARMLFGVLVAAALGLTGFSAYNYVAHDCCSCNAVKHPCCPVNPSACCGESQNKDIKLTYTTDDAEKKDGCCDAGKCCSEGGKCCQDKNDAKKDEPKKDEPKKEAEKD